jgi:hypothetical protein
VSDAPDPLEQAYQQGLAAGRRGEEAMPGCTATHYGRAWLRGYLDAFREAPKGSGA